MEVLEDRLHTGGPVVPFLLYINPVWVSSADGEILAGLCTITELCWRSLPCSVTVWGTGDVPSPKCCPNFAPLVKSCSGLAPFVGKREKHGLAAACAWFQGRIIVLIRLFNNIWSEAAWMFLMFLPWFKCMPQSRFLCYQLHPACIFLFQFPHFLL